MKPVLKSFLSIVFIGITIATLFLNNAPEKNSSHDIAKGKLVFTDNCTGCHGMNGEGSFGPNLTDNYFLHGHHLHNVIHIVKHGNKKGMTAFHHHLTHKQIHDVANYVISIKGTNIIGGKAPQGKMHK